MKFTKFAILFVVLSLFMSGCGTKNAEQTVQKKNGTSGLIVKEGIFNGMADSHTIEITVDKEPLELQVKDELQSTVKALAEGDSIKIQYSVNENKQNELSSIEKLK